MSYENIDFLKKRVAIIITTKNRYKDLTNTLMQLHELGLSWISIYIIDDASEGDIFDSSLKKKFESICIKRNDISKGLIVNRNSLARDAQQDILISLDDDSCFDKAPDLLSLIERFDSDPKLCAVEFENRELYEGDKKALPDRSIIQTYTGFGHAINKKIFNILGGYKEYFIHMCEERDFCSKAWKFGYKVEVFSKISVTHRRSPTARILDRNLYFLCRNLVIFSILNFGWYRFLWLLIGIPYAVITKRYGNNRWVALKGFVNGLVTCLNQRTDFSPMTFRQAYLFRKLPLRGLE